jgi:hypothetical protein
VKKLLPRITAEKRKGIETLLEFCIRKYKSNQSPVGKRLWYERKEFLAELQKKQSYDTKDRDSYNEIRRIYILDRKMNNINIKND